MAEYYYCVSFVRELVTSYPFDTSHFAVSLFLFFFSLGININFQCLINILYYYHKETWLIVYQDSLKITPAKPDSSLNGKEPLL